MEVDIYGNFRFQINCIHQIKKIVKIIIIDKLSTNKTSLIQNNFIFYTMICDS